MTIYEEVTAYYNAFLGEKISIGKSSSGHTMYAMKVGNGRPCGIVQCSIHGREWITAKLCFALMERGVALGSCWFFWFVMNIASYFGKQFAVNVGFFVTFAVFHTFFINFTKKHFRKAFVKAVYNFLKR